MTFLLERTKGRAVIISYLLRILPAVERELAIWRNRAQAIPDAELKRQTLDSIDKKRFHCQGGSFYALYPGAKTSQIISFVVALQTISDYLDNLCDRVAVANDGAFRRLHDALPKASRSGRNKISQRLLREVGMEARLLHKVCLGLRRAGIV